MSFKVLSFEPTPNPNAIKCILDRAISDRPRSFRSRDEAMSDPLAKALFEEAGATSVLLNGDWMAVNKQPSDAWPSVKDRISSILSRPSHVA